MKAVYEMPRVSFEEFAPNMQIASCGVDTTAAFNCLYGNRTETYSVLSSIVGVANCKNQCGFIDYTGEGDGAGFFTGTYDYTTTGYEITANRSNHTDDNTWVEWEDHVDAPLYNPWGGYSVASITASWRNKFAGWLYIFVTGSGENIKTSTDNVSVGNNGGSRITLSSTGGDGGAHLEFLPLFSSSPTSV